MKIPLLFSGLLAVAVAASAQPPDFVERTEPIIKRHDVLEAPVVSSAEAQKLALPDDIQIHLRDVTLRAALQQLQTQSGLPLDWSALAKEKLDAKISVDIDTPSTTRALNAIAEAANLRLDWVRWNALSIWRIQENPDKETPRFAPHFGDEMFATRLLKVDVVRFKQFNLDAKKPVRTQNDDLNLTLELSPDLGWPTSGFPILRAIKAEDDQGRSLIGAARAPGKVGYEGSFQDIWSKKTATLQLMAPEADARKIAHLEGEALYMVAVKRARWEVPDVLENTPQNYNFQIGEVNVGVTLTEAKLEDETVDVRLELALPNGMNWQQFSGNLYSPYSTAKWMKVEDASGTRLNLGGGGGGSGISDNIFHSNGSFTLPSTSPGETEKPKLQLPLKFTFEPPTDWVQAQAKFEFDDVPLP